MISKSLSTSEKFAALFTEANGLAEFCQALYPLLVIHTDDFGRLQGDAFTVKHQCYPASPRTLEEFESGLQALHDVELIIWYVVTGKRYVQIVRFEPHQHGLHKRTRSQFPRVPGTSGNDSENPGQEKGREEKRTEEKRTEEKKTEYSDDFEHFWRIYPRKDGKEAAWKAWRKLQPSDALRVHLCAVADQQKRTATWREQRGKFIPHASTWLNGKRWEDEGVTAVSPFADWTCPDDPPCPAGTTVTDCHRRAVLEEARQARAR